MEYNVALSELVPGMEVQGYYVLRDAQIKKTSTGKPYLSAQLSDATGSPRPAPRLRMEGAITRAAKKP